MNFVNEVWLDRDRERAPENPKYEEELTDRYRTARRKLDSAAAHARLLLPDQISASMRSA